MKKNSARLLLCASVCAAAIGGTALVSYASAGAASTEETGKEHRTPPQDDGSVLAKITAVNGDTLTAVVREKPEQPDDVNREETDTRIRPGKQTDSGSGLEKPASEGVRPDSIGDGGTPPAKPEEDGSLGKHPGGGMAEMEFAGDAVELTLTSSTVVTKGMDRESVSISELAVDSVVRMVLDGTTVVSIEIME